MFTSEIRAEREVWLAIRLCQRLRKRQLGRRRRHCSSRLNGERRLRHCRKAGGDDVRNALRKEIAGRVHHALVGRHVQIKPVVNDDIALMGRRSVYDGTIAG